MATKCNNMALSPPTHTMIKDILGPLGKLGYLCMAVFTCKFLLLMDLFDDIEERPIP